MPHPLMLALLLVQATPQGGVAYRNDSYGFQLLAPAGWVQVPDAVLQVRIAALRRMGASENDTHYVAAFAHTASLSLPYVLVQVNEYVTPMAPSLERLSSSLSTFGNTVQADSGQGVVYVTGAPQRVGPGVALRAYSAIRRGARALVSVMAYGTESDSLATSATRDRFLAGLTVAPPPPPAPVTGPAAVYRDDVLGIAVTAPAGWARVPDSVLHARVAEMRRGGADEGATQFVAAFTLTPGDWFAYPYLLVQVNTAPPGEPMPTTADLLEELGSAGNAAHYDAARDAVLVSGQPTQMSPGISFRSYLGIRLAPRAIVSIMAYGFDKDSSATAAIRDRFLAGMTVGARPRGP
jgi:hypothetical protein